MWVVWTVFSGLAVLVLLGYLEKKQKRAGVYTQPGICYYLKCVAAWLHVSFVRARRERRLCGSDVLPPVDFVTNGYVPPPEDEAAEQLRPLHTAQAYDSLSLCGWNSEGCSLLLRLVRRPGRQASLMLMLTVDGTTYEMPGSPDTAVYNTGVGWRAAGLRMDCEQPMRLWRIHYRGLLRRCEDDNADTSAVEAASTGNLVRANLSLLWRPLAAPLDMRDCDSPLLVRAVARELWTPDFLSIMTSFSLDGYVQCGCLHGHLRLGGAAGADGAPPVEREVRLRGPRVRRWSGEEPGRPSDAASPALRHRWVSLQARTADGSVLWIEASSWRHGITHLVYGLLMTPSQRVHVLDDCSLSLAELGEHSGGPVPPAFNIRFSAGGGSYAVAFITEGSPKTVYTERPWRWMTKLQRCRVCLNDSDGAGIAEFGYPYSGECPLRAEVSEPLLVGSPVPTTAEAPSVLDLDSPECRCEPLVGGKAQSLALMAGMELADATVPQAVVVTSAGWRRHLRQNPHLQAVIDDVVAVAAGARAGDLQQVCQRATEAIEAATVEDDLVEQLRQRLQRVFGDVHAVQLAVRSSAIGEDGEEMSAAGQNATVLGCRGLSQLLAALRRCWGSLLTLHSVQYRRQRGQHVHPGMAVVVQRMVAADTAGVMFTRDPVTGDAAQLSITASYGLGETVVSAAVEPDTITVSRGVDHQLGILDRQIGSKRHQLVLTEDGGTEQHETPAGQTSAACLSDEDALRLARLGVHLERAFGAARDIEWAIAQGRIYLLQSRPVTVDSGWSEFELTHELDSALLTDDLECFTTANIGEVLPEAVTPLTHNVLTYPFTLCTVQVQTELFGVTRKRWGPPAYSGQIFAISSYHGMMHYITLFLGLLSSEAPDASERAQDLTIGGHLLQRPAQRALAVRRHGTLSAAERLRVLAALGKVLWKNRWVADELTASHGAFSLSVDHLTTAQQTFRYFCGSLMELRHVMGVQGHMFTSTAGNMIQTVLLLLLHENGTNEFDETLTADFATLLSSCAGAESADVPAALKRLSGLIAAAEDADQFLAAPPEQAVHWLQTSDRFVAAAYKEFITAHGHRGQNELELYALPWALDPTPLVATLQTMVRSASADTADRHTKPTVSAGADTADRHTKPTVSAGAENTNRHTKPTVSEDEALSQLRLPLSDVTKRILRWMLPTVRASVVRREQTKSLLARAVHQFRLLLRHLGERMVREGRLPEPELVFFLNLYEMQHLLDTRSPALVIKAVRRRRLYPTLSALRFPEMIYGVPRALDAGTPGTGAAAGDVVVRGTPVCHGFVRGTARVVVHLSDAAQIQKDDILVTHATDIGWSPYFPLLGGVVTEMGGLISHGAVVAREYGLPCVVGATAATHLLRSGDLVELDGTHGTITRLKAEADKA